MADDEELLEKARHLDPQAWAAIHDRYYDDLYRYILYRTSDQEAAKDLTSETIIRLLDAIHAGRPIKTLHTWLYGVAAHLATDYFRRQSRHPQVALSDEIEAPEVDPELRVQTALTYRTVLQALRKLTAEQQLVIALRLEEGHSLADTAALMEKSADAIKQLQRRAMAALRRHLQSHDE